MGEEEQRKNKDVDLTRHEHKRALQGEYRSFMIPGSPKTDIDSFFDQEKPHIKTLIKNQLKEMGSAKIIITLWVRWKKPIMPLIELDPEKAKNAQDLDDGIDDNYIRVGIPFNSLMTEFILRLMISMI